MLCTREFYLSCPKDFVGHPFFQWVTVWIPDQNRFGNDNLREHQMSSARRTVKGQGVLKCGARRGNYLDKLRLDCYFDIS
jgi:hypothetical protein